MKKPTTPLTKSVHLTLEKAPDPSRRRRENIQGAELHHFNDDGTASCTYIMDKTGIYKHRFIAVLRTNRFMIFIILGLTFGVGSLHLFVPPNLPSILGQNDVAKEAVTKLTKWQNSEVPITPVVRCMANNENLKIYLPAVPEIRAEFFKIWNKVPFSAIPIYKCSDHPGVCTQTISTTVNDRTITDKMGVTLGAKDYKVLPNDLIPGSFGYTPHYLAFLTSCAPEEFQAKARPIENTLVIPGYERVHCTIGRYFGMHAASFFSTWGYVVIVILAFLLFNKRPYSKRIEDHKNWSIK